MKNMYNHSKVTKCDLVEIISLYLVIICTVVIQPTETIQCCHLIENSHTECSQVCQQGSDNMDMKSQLQQLAGLSQACPYSLRSFWGCVNNSYSVINTVSRWEGRHCCWRALSETCQEACEQGKSKAHVASSCPLRSEQSFHKCLKKQELSIECCNAAAESNCRDICKAVFLQDAPLTLAQNTSILQQCPPPIAACVHNYTKFSKPQDPAESLPCCDESENMTCREHCKISLTTLKDESEIVDSLIRYCDTPMKMMSQNDAMWKCMLKKSSTGLESGDPKDTPKGTIEVAGMDGAKLHCCHKAATTKCKTLCSQTHGRSFSSSWKQFDSDCLLNPSEIELNRCLDEVSEPCSLGCSGMDFCSNFNHRPTEMFRSCNKQAEKLAEITMQKWSEGIINLPLMDHIPVQSINKCHPDWWRVIACALQIKPCHAEHPVTRICYQDCVRVLGACLDRTNLPSDTTHTTLCQKLAPVEGEEEHCIRLGNYLVDSPRKLEHSEVNHPCVPNPCNNTEICVVSRSKCNSVDKDKCPQYACKQGCQLGEVSPVYAPFQSLVRLPLSSQLNCHRMCRCGHHGLLHKCEELGCSKQSDCHLGSGRIHNHDTKFQLDCNECLCYNGEIICTRHECFDPHSDKGYTGLPCNCDTHYMPVCGQNGHTYWNPCLARCSRINDREFQFNECTSHDPCESNSCNKNELCLPHQQKCLHENNCKQYLCINTNKICDKRVLEPVCDTAGIGYRNPCNMLQNGGQLAYWGHCKDGCDHNSGSVCGMDRETYKSECHAWAANVLVDYYGKCHITPALVGRMDQAQYECEDVKCPEILTKEFCVPIKPVGACCYVCASELRVLYSRTLIHNMMDTNSGITYTISEIARTLSNHLSTAECDVFAYISVEQDLVLLVSAITKSPTPVQVDACVLEAEKLKELIDSRASAIQTSAITSPLLAATIKQPQTLSFPIHSGIYGSSASSVTLSFHLLIFSMFCCIVACEPEVFLLANYLKSKIVCS